MATSAAISVRRCAGAMRSMTYPRRVALAACSPVSRPNVTRPSRAMLPKRISESVNALSPRDTYDVIRTPGPTKTFRGSGASP